MAKYFEKKEIPRGPTFFGKCRTRKDAIKLIEMLIARNGKETKMLRINLHMPSDFYKIKNPKYNKDNWTEDQFITNLETPEFLDEMLENIYGGRGISIEYKKIMKYEFGDITRYAVCNANWEFEIDKLYNNSKALIEWSPEREQFLVSMQEQLDEICKRVLNFFSVNTKEELLTRMEDLTKSLPIHK